MCKTTVMYLPRCTPTPENGDCRTGSAALLENLGDLESWKGNHAESFAYLDEALRLYQGKQNIAGMASVLRKQAAAAYRNRELGKVRATANAALTHFRHLDDALGVADASFWLGCSLFLQERDVEALPILSESLAIYRARGNDVGAANCLERIGQIQRLASQEENSLSSFEESLAIASRSGDRLGVARALRGIGYTYFDLSDVAKAIDALSEASAIAKGIGWEDGSSDILRLMGSMKMQTGDHHEAEELYRESISVARKSRARWELALALEESGKCFQNQSKLNEAAMLLEESCLLYRELSNLEQSRQVAHALPQLNSTQGKWDKALFWCNYIIEMYRNRIDEWSIAVYLEEKGMVLLKGERYDEAAFHLEAAIAICRENGYSWAWTRLQLCSIPKTTMMWQRRLPLMCDVNTLQRRLPQLVTASLKLPIRHTHGEP